MCGFAHRALGVGLCQEAHLVGRRVLWFPRWREFHGLAQNLLDLSSVSATVALAERETTMNTSPAVWPPRRILVPVDFSPHSATALAYAVDLAEQVGASVWALHVGVPVPAVYSPLPESTGAQAEIWSDMLARREAIERAELAEVVGAFSEREVAIEVLWAEGEPAGAIVHQAERTDADLVVMGSHGRTGLKRALLGSVAERTARLCGCPVLMLK